MVAFNAVRFKVKVGREQEFLDAHKGVGMSWPGLRHANIIKTGERTYCIIAEWDGLQSLADARPQMIATLDQADKLVPNQVWVKYNRACCYAKLKNRDGMIAALAHLRAYIYSPWLK